MALDQEIKIALSKMEVVASFDTKQLTDNASMESYINALLSYITHIEKELKELTGDDSEEETAATFLHINTDIKSEQNRLSSYIDWIAACMETGGQMAMAYALLVNRLAKRTLKGILLITQLNQTKLQKAVIS